MRLAGAVKSGMVIAVVMMMASVKVAFINDFKSFWRKSCRQLRFHHVLFAIVNGHLGSFSPYTRCASYKLKPRRPKVGQIRTGTRSASKFRPVEMAKSPTGRNVNSCLATP
ncbi:hypothetical protein [Ochrobactrum teleogrylli]